MTEESEKQREIAPRPVARSWPDVFAESRTGPKVDAVLADLVDWVTDKQRWLARRLGPFFGTVNAKLEAQQVEPKAIPARVGIPIIESAAREDREEMRDLWARLLVSAAKGLPVDEFFIDLLRKLDPISALLLSTIAAAEREADSKYEDQGIDTYEPDGERYDFRAHRSNYVRAAAREKLPDDEPRNVAYARLLALGLLETNVMYSLPRMSAAGQYLVSLLQP